MTALSMRELVPSSLTALGDYPEAVEFCGQVLAVTGVGLALIRVCHAIQILVRVRTHTLRDLA